MTALRFIFAWLLLLALPLQGFAAASMRLCEPVEAPAMLAQAQHGGHAAHAGHGGHRHHGADDSSVHATPYGMDEPGHVHEDDGTPGHSCAVCASCGHVVGVSMPTRTLAAAEPVSASLPDPALPELTRATPLPDKPPRI
ncbi:hypothetical protein JI739_13025 [Ramlibacter sp. AW1]|uniref:DUF2946 domain-containing protein n=1 Tax=Ramlibacter aurantiacus TaxID=2801330 RepID=A0A936ZU98_9BURK|nr:hypothetical protein [Ramlibacter aurantiacus]MBL0421275.1 hypothetical protein [Ramlibacter aurantiacus]